MRKFIIIAALAFIAGCGSQSSYRTLIFEWIVSWSQQGSSKDVWLVKGSFGIEDRVGLLFGYADDMYGCQDIALALNERYPAARYYCKYAN